MMLKMFFCCGPLWRVFDLCRSRVSRTVHSCAEEKPAGLICKRRVGFPELLDGRGVIVFKFGLCRVQAGSSVIRHGSLDEILPASRSSTHTCA